jgi:hypothetical protein
MGWRKPREHPPPFIGLCAGDHLHEFYMPLEAGERTLCPECELPMVIYIREPELMRERRVEEIGDKLPVEL